VIPVLYKAVEHGQHRHAIVDGDSHETEMRVTFNLAIDEFKIELLIAGECPIRTSCIRMENGFNSICNHFGSCPALQDGTVNFTKLTCHYGGESKVREVVELWVEGCPLGKNCAGCDDIRKICIPLPSNPDKSHAYITCRTRHRE
jgi:hypothetical protein